MIPFRSNTKGGNILILLMQFNCDLMHAVVVKVRVEGFLCVCVCVGGGGGRIGKLICYLNGLAHNWT